MGKRRKRRGRKRSDRAARARKANPARSVAPVDRVREKNERGEQGPEAAPGAKPSALRLALTRSWNLVGLAAAAGAAAVLRNPWPLAVGVGLEGAWLALATRPRLSRRLFGRHLADWDRRALAHRRRAQLAGLPREEAERCRRLEQRTRRIQELAGENRNLAGRLLEDDLGKLAGLVDAFVELAIACTRWERHLESVDWDELEADLRRHEADAARGVDDEHAEVARQSLLVLERRKAQLEDMRCRLASGRGQLELIESTLLMLGNQVMLMSSPQELTSQLDDLRVGVEAMQETAGDGEVLAAGGRAQAAARARGVTEKAG